MKQPHLLCSARDVSDYCIIVGKTERVIEVVKQLSNPRKVSDNRGYLVYNGEFKNVPVTVCSTGIGGPSAGIVVEELINCGAKVIIRVGSGGVLKKEINTGDLIISTGVCKEERATTAYVPPGFVSAPSFDVTRALIDSAKASKKKFFYGATMCTDAFYAKSHRKQMIEWSKMGVIGSEMESSMLFTIARLRGVKAGMIFYAGLNITRKQTHKDILKQSTQRARGELNAIMVALNALKNLKEVN